MPQTKSATKALKQSLRKHKVSKPRRAELRTKLKKARQAIEKKEFETADKLIRDFQKVADKAVQRKLITANTAARYKSGLAKALKKAKGEK